MSYVKLPRWLGDQVSVQVRHAPCTMYPPMLYAYTPIRYTLYAIRKEPELHSPSSHCGGFLPHLDGLIPFAGEQTGAGTVEGRSIYGGFRI